MSSARTQRAAMASSIMAARLSAAMVCVATAFACTDEPNAADLYRKAEITPPVRTLPAVTVSDCDGGRSSSGADALDKNTSDAGLECACAPPDDAPAVDPPFQGFCGDGCPPKTVCVIEIGSAGPGGGGEYCAAIPATCEGIPTCACMAACVCTGGFGGPERCDDQPPRPGVPATIRCDNGLR